MLKNLSTRTVTTVNFTGSASASARWTPAQTAGAEEVIADYSAIHLEMDLDVNGYREDVVVFEYELPGLRVTALVRNGAVETAFVIEDDTAARLHTAVRKARPVTVSYVKADGEETVRTIEPTGLSLTKAGDVIVKAADRKSGERRSFRIDRISAYTVHRTAFTVRTEAPAPSKAELVQAFRGRPVRHTRHGYTGRVVPGTRAFTPSGWSVIVELDPEHAHLAVGGATRASEDELEAPAYA